MSFKVKDYYFKKAKKENFLARSIYKLEEVDQKYKVLKKGDFVLDLGYYPGSWIQYAAPKVGPSGHVIGVDCKEISKGLTGLSNVSLHSKDVFTLTNLEDIGANRHFDVVLSDMAPNTTGICSVDQARSLELIEKVFELLPYWLGPKGNLVIKAFDGNDLQLFLKEKRSSFDKMAYLRPKSSRSVSKEFFVIGRGFRP